MSVRESLPQIQLQIQRAEVAAGRPPGSVKLIAVSKTKPIEAVQEAYSAGQMDFGENRVQEVCEKQPLLPEARWHLIGTLQRNKVKYIAPFIHLIHSVDSASLMQEISKQAEKHNRIQDVLLQINISHEPQKGGLTEDEAEALLRSISQYPQVRVLGLMGMAEDTDDTERIRAQFRSLKTASERFRSLENNQVAMRELSMGMSGDFEIAIEEGATMVRIGSAVFGGR